MGQKKFNCSNIFCSQLQSKFRCLIVPKGSKAYGNTYAYTLSAISYKMFMTLQSGAQLIYRKDCKGFEEKEMCDLMQNRAQRNAQLELNKLQLSVTITLLTISQ